jgi:hypothetical protein
MKTLSARFRLVELPTGETVTLTQLAAHSRKFRKQGDGAVAGRIISVKGHEPLDGLSDPVLNEQ